ncbi:hypothetical protein EIP86_000564 [Pleurotus ostreatoroseus]|nr:hypothetical protein EIP86_000564 [Pleurotus ostreatoroseus]
MSFSIPTKQRVLLIPESRAAWAIRQVDILRSGAGEVLVRTDAVGLNPVDYFVQKMDYFSPKYPLISGWEGSGTVVQLGDGVTSLSIGDKVFYAGASWENNTTFKEYAVTSADLCGKVPSNLSMEQAASVPLALNTAALGMYSGPVAERSGVGLTPPWVEGGREKYKGQPCIVFGGATSVGQFAIQFAKLSGFSPIITTASLKNAEYLKSLGATHVLDRNSNTPSLIAAIKDIIKEPFSLVYDAVSSEQTQNVGYDLLGSGGNLVIVLGSAIPEEKRTPDKHIARINASPFFPDRRPLSVEMYKQLPDMFERGELKPNHIELLLNGFAGIPDGLERMYRNEISAKKLVARPRDTPQA